MNDRVDRRLWNVAFRAVGLALTAALALIAALALGWNNPRPARPPDWMSTGPPRSLRAGSNETMIALLGEPGSDFTFEVIAQPVAGPGSGFYGYGLAYRAQDADHYYAFAIGGDGYYTVLRVEGQRVTELVPWQQFPHIRRGLSTNRLRVSCDGATCRYRINDEFAATVEDDTWPTGKVGLWVRGFNEKVSVQFSAARLWIEGME